MNCNVLPGQRLARNKGAVIHHGTYLGDNLVAHLNPTGFHIDNMERFAAGQTVYVIGEPVNPWVLQQRLAELRNLNLSYNAITLNCEHVANFLQYGDRKSPQLQGFTLGTLVGFMVSTEFQPLSRLLTIGLLGWAGMQLMQPKNTTVCTPTAPPFLKFD